MHLELFKFVSIFTVPQGAPEIKEPRVHQRGDVTTVSWDVFGTISRLCCFQVSISILWGFNRFQLRVSDL